MHVVGTEVQYSAVRVHVPGTYYIIHTLKQQTATAAVVVLHTVASFVSCCLLYAIYGSIRLWCAATARPKTEHSIRSGCAVLGLAVGTSKAACAAAAACYTARCYCMLLAVYASTAYCCLLHIFQSDMLPLATRFGHSQRNMKRVKKRYIFARCKLCHDS